MTSNLYKVGDWVYCEVSPHQPYVIRKIEELTKTPCGNVEAKVICAFRHQDIPPAIMATVEKYQIKSKLELEKEKEKEREKEKEKEKSESSDSNTSSSTKETNSNVATDSDKTKTTNLLDYEEHEVSELNEQQRYNLKHRELYFSKYTDTIAATTIRAKCSVTLFNEEVERYADFVLKDDAFYYHLTYDPYQKSIVADKGEIRVGMRYQAEIPHIKITPNGSIVEDIEANNLAMEQTRHDRVLRSQLQKCNSKEPQLPEIPISAQVDDLLQWCPTTWECGMYNNKLTDTEIDKFLLLAKSVGTYARALDCNNAFKQPSLPLSAATASRDITLFHAMSVLHENNYDIGKAALSLITQNGPIICKDELEDWSASEANLFEDALEKYGKDFNEIRKDFLPWKSLKSIIEYYYTWKTTDRYVQQKRIKLSEQESKLKQVYIPNHSKQNQSALIKSSHVQFFNTYDIHLKSSCESCGAPNTSTNQWYAYQPSQLVQLIMSGNTNQNALNQAAAQLLAQHQQNGNGNHSIYQARVCADCWIYWKKFSAFKYANAKQERLNQLKNQVHKCSVLGCGREFKLKQLLVKHCGIAHGYFAKTNQPPGPNSPRPPPIRNRTAFYLYTTPMTKAARIVCKNTVKLKKLTRKPFKLVELAELNKEWSKQPRNISEILDNKKKKTIKSDKKLTIELIEIIQKTRLKFLKRKKLNEAKKAKKPSEMNGNATNGHHENGYDDEEDDDYLVIDNESEMVIDEKEKPEFLKYFEAKSTTPCYVPEKIVFEKLSSEQINKYHLNLMSQNRKRPLDTVNDGNAKSLSVSTNENGNGSADTSPLSKRSLLANNHSNHVNSKANDLKQLNAGSTQPTQRMPQRSTIKPTQAINLLDAPEDIYYVATAHLKTLRNEISLPCIQKLARKPYKQIAKQYLNMYETFDKLKVESLAKYASQESSKTKTEKTKLNGNTNTQNIDSTENTNDASEMIINEESSSSTSTSHTNKKDTNEVSKHVNSNNNNNLNEDSTSLDVETNGKSANGESAKDEKSKENGVEEVMETNEMNGGSKSPKLTNKTESNLVVIE